MRLLPVICTLILPFGPLFAGVITVQSKTYTFMADLLMKDHGSNALYKVPLANVDHYLSKKHDIKRTSVKWISKRYVPGKTPLNIVRHYTCKPGSITKTMPAKEFFSSLPAGRGHTYVVLDNFLIFTGATDNPKVESLRDKLTKHYLLSKLQNEVRFSGELHVYKNHSNEEVFAVFDNSSGTYKPEAELLPQLGQLLDGTFNTSDDLSSERLFIVTKKYNQKIDLVKLFAHDENPFL